MSPYRPSVGTSVNREEQGLLVSVPGGVRAVSRLAAEPSHLVKSTLQSEEKQAIARWRRVISLKTVASIWMPGLPPWRWRGDPRPERSPGGHQ
ncbi:hypothetical protein NMY30_28440 (plasmid) [Klebsiella pneumoniae subsp. pneumoniae]|uniref:hypothetical protein n=1 Tax=Klebsiella pneumoniae TaxID=573 RepID=UPI0021034D8D|nr:hypothetical protein [Klebsiella pneumoniae]UTX03775.1 hypothetical protein NMY30_28440 [Klebsiella pneumoniae subsp. pneumoniae]